MREILSGALLVIGTTFMFLAAVGLVRQPDIYLRMSATSKATSLGVGSVLLAAAIYFGDFAITARALAAIIFIMICTPVAAHMIGRAAYFTGTPLWEGTLIDELRGHYDPRTHELESVSFPELDIHLPDMAVRKFTLPAGSDLEGLTLAEIDLRRKYDITLLAIRRGAEVISNPGGDIAILTGDELVIMGHPERLSDVRTRIRRIREAAVPANPDG
jgi:multicomponent Na+:H+ antiporter subunit G